MKQQILVLFILVISNAVHATIWNCRNPIEINCADDDCIQIKDHTPMDIYVDEEGSLIVCAYSGCWEGTGKVFHSKNFLIVAGLHLDFVQGDRRQKSEKHILIGIDRNDSIGFVKSGAINNPITCHKQQ
jgi:hypothetical protein